MVFLSESFKALISLVKIIGIVPVAQINSEYRLSPLFRLHLVIVHCKVFYLGNWSSWNNSIWAQLLDIWFIILYNCIRYVFLLLYISNKTHFITNSVYLNGKLIDLNFQVLFLSNSINAIFKFVYLIFSLVL